MRVLEIAHVGDLAGGEASPEPLQILLLYDFGEIQIREILVFFERKPAVEENLDQYQRVVGHNHLNATWRPLESRQDEALVRVGGRNPSGDQPERGHRREGSEPGRRDPLR